MKTSHEAREQMSTLLTCEMRSDYQIRSLDFTIKISTPTFTLVLLLLARRVMVLQSFFVAVQGFALSAIQLIANLTDIVVLTKELYACEFFSAGRARQVRLSGKYPRHSTPLWNSRSEKTIVANATHSTWFFSGLCCMPVCIRLLSH